MSTSRPQNVYSAIAQHLANPRVLSAEEQLFQDALQAVEVRRKQKGNLPKIFVNLNQARSLEDVRSCIAKEKESNTVWKQPKGKSWMEQFGKYAECIWRYKGIVDGIVSGTGTSVAAPIWGSITFVINVFKDLGVTVELAQDVERILEASGDQVQRYLKRSAVPSSNLRKRLLSYYEAVLDFAIDTHQEFSKSPSTTAFRLIERKVLTILKRFNEKIRPIISDLNTAAQDDTLQDVHKGLTSLKDTISNRPLLSAPPVQPSLSKIYGVPQLSRSFIGQGRHIIALRDLLHDNHSYTTQTQGGQKRAVVYGAGGTGKTQILVKYAHEHLYSTAVPQKYDAAIWINATSEITIQNDIMAFMEINGFQEPLTDIQGNMRYAPFHARLQQHCKRWLLIFDNVKEYHDVQKAIPPIDSGHVLFSTRAESVAGLVAPYSKPVEVLPMDVDTATALVSNLAEHSGYDQDKGTAVARAVATFARGLPLLIEQIVNNAILENRTLIETLKLLENKKTLLRQKAVSSLHENDLSLGAMALQNFETLRAQSLTAEALYKILVYLEPSSIPLSLFQDIRGKFHEFQDRQLTYSSGALDKSNLNDRQASLHVPSSGAPPSEDGRRRLRLWSPFRRSKSAAAVRANDVLPVDDAKIFASFFQACGKGTALSELLENKVVLESSIMILLNSSIIRKPNDHELWMHDLTSEVAKALLMYEPVVYDPEMSLAAAIMVYTLFPTPSAGLGGIRRTACRTYLPHAISCHTNLKKAGILNNCSIGPELSHLIASTLHNLGVHLWDENGLDLPEEQRQKKVNEIINYYRQAYEGYLAGWRRLKSDYGIDDEAIFLHIRTDRQQEASFSFYYIGRYAEEHERLGCNAPWRAIQTACKLAYLLERDPTTIDEAIAYTRAVLKFCTLAFGSSDLDTINMKRKLYQQLRTAERWQEAYDISIQSIKDLGGWRPGDDKHNAKTTFEAVVRHDEAWTFASQLGHCCMALSDNSSPSQSDIRTWALEAVMWIEIALRYVCKTYGPDEHYARDLYGRYAEAQERAGDPRAALYWYGRGVFCALAQIIWENGDWGSDPDTGAVTPEFLIEAQVATFEAAMARLVGEATGQLGRFGDLDIDLRRYLTAVEGKIAVWRADREEFGVSDSVEDAWARIDREFEENEERIRLQEEEMYGKIPALDELDDLDEDKENMKWSLQDPAFKVRDKDMSLEEVSQVPVAELKVGLTPRDA